jgi:hypothetical protein
MSAFTAAPQARTIAAMMGVAMPELVARIPRMAPRRCLPVACGRRFPSLPNDLIEEKNP